MDKKAIVAALRRRPSFQFGRGSSRPKDDKRNRQSKALSTQNEVPAVETPEEHDKKLEESLTDQEVEATFEKMLVSYKLLLFCFFFSWKKR